MITGIPNHGNLRIGDSLTEGEDIRFTGVPSFAPEILRVVRPLDPLKAKHLGRALKQLAEEGTASVFKPMIGPDWTIGVVGNLQLDVIADRIRTEYGVQVQFEKIELLTARWVESDCEKALKTFIDSNKTSIARDHDDVIVFLARNTWHLGKTTEEWKQLKFNKIKEQALS